MRASFRLPIALSDESEPEPDIAIVPKLDYPDDHPASALLVVEIADSSIRKDRELKARLYASAGVPEYWLIALAADTFELRWSPEGDRYAGLQVVTSGTVCTVSVAAFDVALPTLLVATARYCAPLRSNGAALTVRVAVVTPPYGAPSNSGRAERLI